MSWFRKKDKPKEPPPAAVGCSAALERTCPTCHCPVGNPYAVTCPRCREQLPPLPDCGTCKHCK